MVCQHGAHVCYPPVAQNLNTSNWNALQINIVLDKSGMTGYEHDIFLFAFHSAMSGEVKDSNIQDVCINPRLYRIKGSILAILAKINMCNNPTRSECH